MGRNQSKIRLLIEFRGTGVYFARTMLFLSPKKYLINFFISDQYIEAVTLRIVRTLIYMLACV